jgi:exodeoxyribonuclease VII large subunit
LGLRVVDAADGLASRLVWSVAALVRAVADALTARFSVCAVHGEISGFARAASGHCYFNLKDADGGSALMRCTMFRRAAGLLDFNPADGQLVELRGRLGLYEPRGELQFVVEAMQRAGAGALYEQFLKLKASLQAQGLFDVSSKRALPAHPRCIGVITSLDAAALSDVVTALARRAPQVQVIVYPSLVQGPDAPAALSQAMALAARRGEADTLIVCRGGGSLQDLWAFNDERVVRAIRASPIPVVCGVGHETDVTLADLAADVRAPTPTAAAELSAAPRDDLLSQLEAKAKAMLRGMDQRLQSAAQGLDRLGLLLRKPDERLNRQRMRLQWAGQRLKDRVDSKLARCRDTLGRMALELRHRFELDRARRQHQLRSLETRLSACDPYAVVARGYALIQTRDATLVVDPDQLQAGAELKLTLARGQADVRLASVRRK